MIHQKEYFQTGKKYAIVYWKAWLCQQMELLQVHSYPDHNGEVRLQKTTA
jgi:hypothetical protein